MYTIFAVTYVQVVGENRQVAESENKLVCATLRIQALKQQCLERHEGGRREKQGIGIFFVTYFAHLAICCISDRMKIWQFLTRICLGVLY